MKLYITIAAVFCAFILPAQSSDFQIQVSKDQSISSSFWINSMTVKFGTSGSHFTDGLDQPGAVSDPSFIFPYTIDSAAADLLQVDSRPSLRSNLQVPFGVWTATDANLYVQGSWLNPALTAYYNVTLTDNQTGLSYDLYNETLIPVLMDVSFINRFTITFSPKALYQAFDESCFGQADGSAFIQSPEPNWMLHIYRNSVFLNTVNVLGTDTLLTNLAAGAYDFVYALDNTNIDTTSINVSGPAAINSMATASNYSPVTTELVNFTNTSTGAINYLWDFGDGSTSTAFAPTYAYSLPGTYTVTLTSYNAYGCSNSTQFTMNVLSGSISGNPTFIGRNNFNNQYTIRKPVTVTILQDGHTQLNTDANASIELISIYSISGQLIFSGMPANNTITFQNEVAGICIIHTVYTDGTENAETLYLQ